MRTIIDNVSHFSGSVNNSLHLLGKHRFCHISSIESKLLLLLILLHKKIIRHNKKKGQTEKKTHTNTNYTQRHTAHLTTHILYVQKGEEKTYLS